MTRTKTGMTESNGGIVIMIVIATGIVTMTAIVRGATIVTMIAAGIMIGTHFSPGVNIAALRDGAMGARPVGAIVMFRRDRRRSRAAILSNAAPIGQSLCANPERGRWSCAVRLERCMRTRG